MERLLDAGIEQVIDVRERAMSRKPGFSGGALRAELDDAGIDYRHIPELGSPSEVRAEYKESGDFEKFRHEYESHLEKQTPFLELLLELMSLRTTALLCFERDSQACHRSLICEQLERPGLSFNHL
jgi:uncharacterized protein (DUF488 family)